jgi:peptidoglycan/LPS O-acetylase OafA/YrhL
MTDNSKKLRVSQRVESASDQLGWVDAMKGVALAWIFLNHSVERLFGFPFFANPTASWPPFGDRLSQILPLHGNGAWDVPLNLLRWLGWSGDQGVQLFLILSGFGLTWGLLRKSAPSKIDTWSFYRRRVFRIFPLWWAAHLVALVLSIVWGPVHIDDYRFYLSFLGIRLTPDLLDYVLPAWWYIGLLLQLYLVYPWLWSLLCRKGLLRFLLIVLGISLAMRLLGLLYFDAYLECWSRGAVFISRLPEFALGMGLAYWIHIDPGQHIAVLKSLRFWILGVLIYGAGFVLSFTLIGMAPAAALLGCGAFLILFKPLQIAESRAGWLSDVLKWIGRHSYSLYLVHGFLVALLIPVGLGAPAIKILVYAGIAVVGTGIFAITLEATVERVEKLARNLSKRGSRKKLLLAAGATVGFLAVALLACESLTRGIAPQEVLGWGERPSLESSAKFGWRLIPNKVTRLRWESYDYVVKANSLGFPAPEYPGPRARNSYRILVTGDAFTSAEGVNTEESWPRILERKLNVVDSSHKHEILNFAITGYGPYQYAAVIDSFAPIFKPGLIIVEMFVNDFQDVLVTNQQFRSYAGFADPPGDGWQSYLRLAHLSRYLRSKVVGPLVSSIRGEPSPGYGYFLGNFEAFEKMRTDVTVEGRRRVRDCMTRIREVASRIDAGLMVIMVPASIQVCRSDNLEYYPGNVNLADSSQFDLEIPQRMAREIADSLRVPFIDLRGVLSKDGGSCVYHPRNMHWTNNGHQLVAAYLAQMLRGTVDGKNKSSDSVER